MTIAEKFVGLFNEWVYSKEETDYRTANNLLRMLERNAETSITYGNTIIYTLADGSKVGVRNYYHTEETPLIVKVCH